MKVTIVKDDNRVVVDGVTRTVDCSGMDSNVHAVQWNGETGRGEVEYALTRCDGCGGNHKEPNRSIASLADFQPYVDAWVIENEKALKAEAEAKAAAEAAMQAAQDEAAKASGNAA